MTGREDRIPMTETSETIRTWSEETFGPADDLTALVRRARLELDELEVALRAGNNAEARREAADVAILLHRLCGLCGGDLAQAVDDKMAVNRARTWTRAGDGTGGHV
jgi:NTP pyrophosphatase (non-canonical NTP hydrolase)